MEIFAEIFANHVFEHLYSEYKKRSKLHKKISNPIKWIKYFNGHFTKDVLIANKHNEKVVSIVSCLGNAAQNHNKVSLIVTGTAVVKESDNNKYC